MASGVFSTEIAFLRWYLNSPNSLVNPMMGVFLGTLSSFWERFGNRLDLKQAWPGIIQFILMLWKMILNKALPLKEATIFTLRKPIRTSWMDIRITLNLVKHIYWAHDIFRHSDSYCRGFLKSNLKSNLKSTIITGGTMKYCHERETIALWSYKGEITIIWGDQEKKTPRVIYEEI